MSSKRQHAEWLSLVEVSGPFLAIPVLDRVFPQGLDKHESEQARGLRLAYEEWKASQGGSAPNTAVHREWLRFVLRDVLELPDEVLAEDQAVPQALKAVFAEHAETLRPDSVVRNPEDVEPAGMIRMLVQSYPAGQPLQKPLPSARWKASPATRMAELLRTTDVRLGLVTNGEQWMLVDAPRGETAGFASWYASLWLDEPLTLRAFRTLLSVGRFFGSPGETLEAMLAESGSYQQEVTDQLGLQVRRAVEVLVHSIDRADQDHGRQLLRHVPEGVLYEAALTVMMRLVFLFCAEERGLLLLGDPLYDEHYAVSTLVAQLQDTADTHGEEVLERRYDAWSRLLSTFRAVHAGVTHERLTLPAYGGTLFDPDRFPFLEGRRSDTSWESAPADPLPVDNRTVLHLLRSLQYLQTHGEAQRISFRALGIEQIGHVYEGLLDHTAVRAAEPALGLSGPAEPEVALSELERRVAEPASLIAFLQQETDRSANALKSALASAVSAEQIAQIRAACGGDVSMLDRVRPFAALVRDDSFGRPVVIRPGSVYVTAGTDRRASGTHYTPACLSEPVVRHTLENLCYEGPAEGRPRNEWQLRSAGEILGLKVCDLACGSGAFLVQACRYLSERLVEAWERLEAECPSGVHVAPLGLPSAATPTEQPLPAQADERIVYAQRLVAQRCLFGVDKNPLAVEMAKLSLWLLTLAKEKPFTFLDHSLRQGDALVGVNHLDQLLQFSFSQGVTTGPLFEHQRQEIARILQEAVTLRRAIEEEPSNTHEELINKAALLERADQQVRRLTYAADVLLATTWRHPNPTQQAEALASALIEVEYAIQTKTPEELECAGQRALQAAGVERRFHWPLVFPEIFADGRGFQAILGNPPFVGGTRISTQLGRRYIDWLINQFERGGNRTDYVSYFFQRAWQLLDRSGFAGLIASNSIAETDTRRASLDLICDRGGTIFRAAPESPWPGISNVTVSIVQFTRSPWHGTSVLDGTVVPGISRYLRAEDQPAKNAIGNIEPVPLAETFGVCGLGSKPNGTGFVLAREEAERLLETDSILQQVIRPYLSADDIVSTVESRPSRYVINFGTASAEYCEVTWPTAFSIVVERVRPTRISDSDRVRREKWWQFERHAKDVYEAISSLSRCLVTPEVAKHLIFSWQPTNVVIANTCVVVATEEEAAFAVLQSSIHECWARRPGQSRLESRPRYNAETCFRNFPIPQIGFDALRRAGIEYYRCRSGLSLKKQRGLTHIYNLFHEPAVNAAEIDALRAARINLDRAVAVAYGWDDLDLDHGFHHGSQGPRFTVSDGARSELLRRLLRLNYERHQTEVSQGLRVKSPGRRSTPGRRRVAETRVAGTASLFGDDEGG